MGGGEGLTKTLLVLRRRCWDSSRVHYFCGIGVAGTRSLRASYMVPRLLRRRGWGKELRGRCRRLEKWSMGRLKSGCGWAALRRCVSLGSLRGFGGGGVDVRVEAGKVYARGYLVDGDSSGKYSYILMALRGSSDYSFVFKAM